MSEKTYTVKPGDTLLAIAIEQNINLTTLLELNPKYQPNPDLIHIGDIVLLPEEKEEEQEKEPFTIDPVKDICPKENGVIVEKPRCQAPDIEDIVFVTGEPANKYYCLSKEAIDALEEEVKITTILFERYQELVQQAPTKPKDRTEIEAHQKKRAALLDELIHAGVLPKYTPKNPASTRAKLQRKLMEAKQKEQENLRCVQANVQKVKERIDVIKDYVSPWFDEKSSLELQEHIKRTVLPSLEQELTKCQSLLKEAEKPRNLVTVKSMDVKRFNGHDTRLFGIADKHTGIKEIYYVKKNIVAYIREAYFQKVIRNDWIPTGRRRHSTNYLKDGKYKKIGEQIAKDIREDLSSKFKNPTISSTLLKWQSPSWKHPEWKATGSLLNDEQGEKLIAVNSEAHLFRWAMQGAFDFDFKPLNKDSNGNATALIDFGVGFKAALSVLEASVSAEGFFPSEIGMNCRITYLDANGKEAHFPIGDMRLRGLVKLGCFVGVSGQARMNAGNTTLDGGDDTGILFDPEVTLGHGKNRQIGAKASIFGGGQISGEISGAIQWKAPEIDKKTTFVSLASVSADGNVSVGAGYQADFELFLENNKLFLRVAGRIVWGIGGGGGFSVGIDFVEIWELVKVLWQGMEYIDFREIYNMNSEAERFLACAAFATFAAAPSLLVNVVLLQSTISLGSYIIFDYMKTRNKLEDEALIMANRILDSDSILNGVPFSRLPPKTIGMMLHTLAHTFLFNWEQKQELAICKLLSESTHSWYKFTLILSMMNKDGEHEPGEKTLFKNIERLNVILDNRQQRDFNRWVASLAQSNRTSQIPTPPFVAYQGDDFNNKNSIVKQQYAAFYKQDTSTAYV